MLYDVIDLAKESELDKKTLLTATMELLKEADNLERKSSDLKGKAAIEYLLNCKYEIVTDRDIPSHNKDILIETIDKVIDKIVVRYKIEHKKDKFTFKEDATPVQQLFYFPQSHPEFDNDLDLHREIHKLRFELDSKKAELIKMTVNSPMCKPLQDEIRMIEDRIRELIREIANKKAFSTYGIDSIDSNKENLREYKQKRRLKMSTNERLSERLERHIAYITEEIEAKKAAGTGAQVGGLAGAVTGTRALNRMKTSNGKMKKMLKSTGSKANKYAHHVKSKIGKAALHAVKTAAKHTGAGAAIGAGAGLAAAGLAKLKNRNKK